MVGGHVGNAIDQEGDNNGRGDIGVAEMVQGGEFLSNGADSVAGKTVNEHEVSHKCDNGPPVLLLLELRLGFGQEWLQWGVLSRNSFFFHLL